MARFGKTGMKILKIIHIIGACCWLGGACSMLALNLGSHQATSPAMLTGINYASHLIDIWIVVTCGLYACIITGFLYGLFTPWGFTKHRWVLCKWIVTLLCFASGWLFLGSWEAAMLAMSESMTSLDDPSYAALRSRHFFLSLLQISLIVFMVVISVVKPWKSRDPNAKALSG